MRKEGSCLIQGTKFFVSPLKEVEPGMENDPVLSAGNTAILLHTKTEPLLL